MAHFAELDKNNIVLQVLVIDNKDIIDNNGNESEQKGIDFLASLGLGDRWVQTSYNNNFRGTYAGIGDIYDVVADVFINPTSL